MCSSDLVDHADDAVDHRVADGDEPVDRAEREAVDELLEEVFHAIRSKPGLSRRIRCQTAFFALSRRAGAGQCDGPIRSTAQRAERVAKAASRNRCVFVGVIAAVMR